MDGLLKIITKIQEDTKLECEAIIDSANKEAQNFLEESKKTALDKKDKEIKSADDKANLIISKAHSSADVEYKRHILKIKGEIIDGVICDTVKYFENLPEDKTLEYVLCLLKKYALNIDGEIVFCQNTFKKMPDDIEKQISSALKNSCTLKVASEKINDSVFGFVISYPEMRINCTVESLILDNEEQIRDKLSKILFS